MSGKDEHAADEAVTTVNVDSEVSKEADEVENIALENDEVDSQTLGASGEKDSEAAGLETAELEAGKDDALGGAPESGELEPAAAPEEIKPLALLPALPTAHVVAYLESLERLLKHALREEGEFLWDSGSVLPVFHGKLNILSQHETDEEVIENLKVSRSKIEESSGLHWSDRGELFEQALSSIVSAKAVLDNTRTHPKMAELLLPEQGGDDTKPIKNSRRDTGRGGRPRRGRRRDDADLESNSEREHRHSDKQFRLGDEAHTGTELSELSDVSDDLLASLQSAGFSTIADLLMARPVEHEKLDVNDNESAGSGSEVVVHGTVLGVWTRVMSDDVNVVEIAVDTGDDTKWCKWTDNTDTSFAQVGRHVCLIGSDARDDALFNPIPWRIDARGVVRRPNYGVAGVDDTALRRLIRRLISEYVPNLRDSLPKNVLNMGRVKAIREAIRELHVPSGGRRHGISRMVFEELFRHQLVTATKGRKLGKGIAHPVSHEAVTQLQVQHGIDLTDDQEIAFDEIRRDLISSKAMTRLLQGDVGSGKAVVALLSAVMVASTRTQVLFLAPDHLAAEHRYMFAEPLLRSVGLVPQLITHSPTPGQLDALKRGQANMIFATHSLVKDKLPNFNKLGFVVVEERESFGVIAREVFAGEKSSPDVLVVTSVPIPSSLAFTIFADHDISVLGGGGGNVVSNVVAPEDRDTVYVALGEAVKRGQQAYIVFPMPGGSDLIDREKASVLISAMEQEAFPGAKVGLFHGSMTRDERTKVYEKFVHREIDILVATTGIEDAPEIENASVMMVENADHYDLVRLYRLKGHVATGGEDAFVHFVLSKKPSEEGERLVTMVSKEIDAFKLAERDRKVRGDKALLGDKAAKLPEFNWADSALDRDVLIRARQVVSDILMEDPRLHRRIYRDLIEELGISVADGGNRRRRGGGGRSSGRRQSDRNDGGNNESESKGSSNKGRSRRKRGRSRRRSS